MATCEAQTVTRAWEFTAPGDAARFVSSLGLRVQYAWTTPWRVAVTVPECDADRIATVANSCGGQDAAK